MFLSSFWNYILMSAPYLLLGLFIAGLVHNFLTVSTIKKHLGTGGWKSVFKAAILGIPLPLCSCSVLPSAVTLKKAGANNGATSAFLIATPETGVDSIILTYGIMDGVMTVVRPLVAFVTACTAGLLQLVFNKEEQVIEKEATPTCKCGPKEEIKEESSCCHSTPKKEESSCCHSKPKKESKIVNTFVYGYFNILEDISFWLTFGLIAGGLIDFFVPVDFFQQVNGVWGRLLILAIGIPFYICASASTPIAASMVMKGMSPGAALIFLLVGPATNISNILVMQKFIGKKGVIINIAVMAVLSFAFSFLVDYIYIWFELPINFNISGHEHTHHEWYHHAMGIIFVGLLLRGLYRSEIRPRIFKHA